MKVRFSFRLPDLRADLRACVSGAGAPGRRERIGRQLADRSIPGGQRERIGAVHVTVDGQLPLVRFLHLNMLA
jgi:hypothetical protein